MKKLVAMLLALTCLTLPVLAASAEEVKFVTIQEWLDAKGECGECMLLVRIREILNPVWAEAEDETGSVKLFSGSGEDEFIINFMDGERDYTGCVLAIANPRFNEWEGNIEMADWTLLRILPPAEQPQE